MLNTKYYIEYKEGGMTTKVVTSSSKEFSNILEMCRKKGIEIITATRTSAIQHR